MTKNKKIVISVISAVLALIILFSVITININAATEAKMFANTNVTVADLDFDSKYSENDATLNLSKVNHAGKGFVKVAETNALELYYKKDYYKQLSGKKVVDTKYVTYNIAVYHKQSKKLWKAIPEEKDIDFKNLSEINLTQLQSLVSFDYFDVGKNNNKTTASNTVYELIYGAGESDLIDSMGESEDEFSGMSEEEIEMFKELLGEDFEEEEDKEQESTAEITNTEVTEIPSGVRFTYKLDQRSIEFSVEFRINGDTFDVTVPKDSIIENIGGLSQLEAERSKVEAQINQLSPFFDAIRSSTGYKKLEVNQKNQIDKIIENAVSKVNGLSSMIRTGSSTDENFLEIQDSISNLSSLFADYGGFEDSIIENINKKLDEVRASIDSMSEYSLCGLVTVNPLPYFGSATSKEDGYVFYPDGSGALSYFNVRHSEYSSAISNDVYSNYISDIATYLDWTDEEDTDYHEVFTSVKMPVFGVKKPNAAFVSIIAEGDADAAIKYQPYNASSKLNTISASFYTRITTQNTDSEGNVSNVIDTQLVNHNRRILYKFLAGNDADYAGMAVKYREYLEEYGLINKSKLMENSELPLFLNLFMGYKSSGRGANAKYKSLTTYEQAQTILSDLKAKGINNINTYMSGWSTAGYFDEYPDNKLKPEGKLGGKNDFEKLASYANENNITLALENGFIFADDDYISFTQKDIATTKNYGDFTISFWGKYMFNPNVVYNRALEAADIFKGYGANSIMFADEGRLVYDDYNSKSATRYHRGLTQQTFVQLATKVKEKLATACYENANIYMAQTADWLASVPEESSKLLIFDEDVPFMQIVLHGHVPYTGTSYNNMYEINKQSLKYIEYGYLPFYVVTNDVPDVRDNYTDFLFSTDYNTWSPTISETYNEYKNSFGDIWNVKITDHEKLNNGLVCVTYENGTKVVINYSTTNKKYKNKTIKAENYIIIK